MLLLEQASSSKLPWKNSSYANLIRYEPSGTYFARVRVGGKLIRQSLKTKVCGLSNGSPCLARFRNCRATARAVYPHLRVRSWMKERLALE
jgi:hypothetical protein